MKRIFARPRGRRGVTLVELLAVLAILLVLGGLGGPKMYRWAQVAGQRGAANQVVADLALTRVQAVRSGQTVSMRIESATRYRITLDNAAGAEVRELKDVDLSKLYKDTSLSPTGRIAFDSRGMLRTAGTNVTIERGGVQRAVTITTVGRIVRGNLYAN